MLLNYLFFITVFLLSLGQFAQVLPNFYLFDLSIALFAFLGVFYFLGIKKTFKLPKNFLILLGFSAFAFLSLVVRVPFLGSSEFLEGFFYFLRWFSYLLASLVVFNMLSCKMLTGKGILHTFLTSAFFVAFAGFIQLILLPDFETLDIALGWDPHKNRLASTFFDPNFVGGYLCLVLALLLGQKRKYPLVIITLVSALVLTFSRSSWAMFAVIIFIYGVFKHRKWLLLAFLLAFLAYFAVPRVQTRLSGVTDPSDSAHFRLISWQNTWEIAKDNLFLGVGFNTFRSVQKDYGFLEIGESGGHAGAGSDSSLLLILATTGVFGFILFLGGYLQPLFFNKTPLYDKLPLLAAFGGLLIHSQFVNSLFYPQILFLWLISSFLIPHL
jgi:O-antigen ligase